MIAWIQQMKPWQILLQLYGIGLIGHLCFFSRNWMVLITPFFLMGVSLYLLYLQTGFKNKKLLAVLFFIYCDTFLIEALGVATGKVFGVYWYGHSLGYKVLEVPLVIGLNWVIVLLGAICLSEKLVKNKLGVVFLSALWVTLLDMILEPVAMKLGYWDWEKGLIPLQNYLGWFCVAFVNAGLFKALKFSLQGNILFYHFMIQAGFFAALYFGLKIFPGA